MDSKLENPQLKQGYLYAVRLLSASKKSERELEKRLKDRGYPESIIFEIIQKLKSQKILSDLKLTEETVQNTLIEKRYGPRRIYYKLIKRGISGKEAQKASQAYPKDLERETAKELAEQRWLRLEKVEFQKRKKRLYDFLINRGFNLDIVREVVNQVSKGTNEDF